MGVSGSVKFGLVLGFSSVGEVKISKVFLVLELCGGVLVRLNSV